jgi:hypothetical protein
MARNPDLVKLCPARDCRGGYASKQRSITKEDTDIPADRLATVKGGLRRCGYCGLVWEYNDRGGNPIGWDEGEEFIPYK